MHASVRTALLSSAALALAAAPAAAQSAADSVTAVTIAPPAPQPAPVPAPLAAPLAAQGPTLAAATAAVRAPVQADGAAPALMQRRSMGQPQALMIVGAAAFVAGALIGGDAGPIFMVGGAVVGLYGLYEYLK